MDQDKFLEIIDDLYSEIDNERGWKYILNKVKKLLNVDSVFFASKLDSDTFECFGSESIDLPKNVIKNSIAIETINLQKDTIVNNYPSSRFAKEFWVKEGVRSVASVPVVFSGTVFGALLIASFSESEIPKKKIEALKAFAKIISFVLFYKRKSEATEKILSLMVKEFEFFYSRKLPDFFDKKDLKRWVVEYLKNIMSITESNAVGFVYPRENIYTVVYKENGGIKEDFYAKNTKEVRDYILYKIWENSIGDIVTLDDLKKYGIQQSSISKKIGIKSALLVPVKFNNEVVVVVGFGYDKKKDVDKDYKLALQNSATHLTFMLLASKNLSFLNNKLIDLEESFLESFVLMMEARDVYTKGHSLRVAYYSSSIARALELPEKQQKKIYIAGLLHDIGKIGIPDNILLKPGKLSPNEYEIIKHHVEFSYQIIKNIKSLKDIADIVRYHHERCDGSGYFRGLKGDEIPIGAKILAIADIFDAVTTTRPYRKRLTVDEALNLLIDMKEQLDQNIVKKSISVLKESFHILKDQMKERDFLPEDIDVIRQNIFIIDYMTGLLRRKQFVKYVDDFAKNLRRFYMFYFDIKNLSFINHRYSMEVGDKIILYTAEALKEVKNIKFLARTEPDAFYFIHDGDEEPGLFMLKLKKYVKKHVTDKLLEKETNLIKWDRAIDYYVSFSEFLAGKTAEDMMYECKKRKKEIEELLI